MRRENQLQCKLQAVIPPPRRRNRSRRKSWQAGDSSFDTPEMWAKRLSLRDDPAVTRALNAWWHATDADRSGSIDRDEYIALGKALYRVMINDGDEQAAQSSAESDWESDSRGKEQMGGESFKKAMFQLCDLWTDTLEPAEYASFLDGLLAKLRAQGLGGGIDARPSRVLEQVRDQALDAASSVTAAEGPAGRSRRASLEPTAPAVPRPHDTAGRAGAAGPATEDVRGGGGTRQQQRGRRARERSVSTEQPSTTLSRSPSSPPSTAAFHDRAGSCVDADGSSTSASGASGAGAGLIRPGTASALAEAPPLVTHALVVADSPFSVAPTEDADGRPATAAVQAAAAMSHAAWPHRSPLASRPASRSGLNRSPSRAASPAGAEAAPAPPPPPATPPLPHTPPLAQAPRVSRWDTRWAASAAKQPRVRRPPAAGAVSSILPAPKPRGATTQKQLDVGMRPDSVRGAAADGTAAAAHEGRPSFSACAPHSAGASSRHIFFGALPLLKPASSGRHHPTSAQANARTPKADPPMHRMGVRVHELLERHGIR